MTTRIKVHESQMDETTFKQAVDSFIDSAPSGGWGDYWEMQQDWAAYIDGLCRDGSITQRQYDNFSNPCTPETFDRWQKRNGLVRRRGGYESKKPEAYEPKMTPPWGPSDMEYTQDELTGDDVLGDFFLQALQYLRKDLGYSYDLKQERHLLTKLTRLFDKGLDYKKAIDTILSNASFCARTGIRKPTTESKKSETYVKDCGESMKNEANINDLKNKVISDGTHNTDALIGKFLNVLKTYAPERYTEYMEENPEMEDWKSLDDETKVMVSDELFDELNKIAPEGCYFGASEGDGACFGFWCDDENESFHKQFEVLTKSVLKCCDNLVKDTSLAGDFDDEVIYTEDAVKNAVEAFKTLGESIVRLKTVLESHKNEDNMEVIGILSDAITKIVADEQGDVMDKETAGADDVIDRVSDEYGRDSYEEPVESPADLEPEEPAAGENPPEEL